MDSPGLAVTDRAPRGISSEPRWERWCSPERILAALSEPLLVLDAAGLIVWANAGAVQLFGWGLAELIGARQHELLPHLHRDGTPCDSTRCELLATARDGKARSARGAIFQRKDRRLLEVDCVSAPMRFEGGLVGAVAVFRSSAPPPPAPERDLGGDSVARSILGQGADGAFLMAADGRYLAVNRALAEIHGYASTEECLEALTAGGCEPYVEPGRREELAQLLRDDGGVSRWESQIERRDGTTTWISETVRPVGGEAGEPFRYEGTVQDITWRKLTEEVLQQAEDKWRALAETSGACIVIADGGGTIFFANGAAQKSALGLPGRNVFEEFDATSQRALQRTIQRALQTMQAEELDVERTGTASAPACYEVRVVPIAQAGTVARVILIAVDITARRQAEEAVRESQRFIGRVADASPAILYVYDLAGERYVYVNSRVEKILGYTAEDFLSGGRLLAEELVHRDDAGLLVERRRCLATATDDGIVFECELRMRHAAGHWLTLRTRDVVFTRGADGRPVQIIGMAEDVTERQRSRLELEHSREQLRALSARLEEAREEERAAISRRVHDELGQALTALNWELTRLQERLVPTGKRAQPGLAAKVQEMAGMVDTMMQTVRTVSAELRPPILDHFGLVAAIEWQAQEFETRYRTICEVVAREGIALADRDVSTAVFRIFQEILTNIARHAGATKVRVQFHENAGGFVLIVHDNGRGITAGQKSQSLGILGMSERAHLFGGKVAIDGIPGKGTTVTVFIPPGAGAPSSAPRKETLRPR